MAMIPGARRRVERLHGFMSRVFGDCEDRVEDVSRINIFDLVMDPAVSVGVIGEKQVQNLVGRKQAEGDQKQHGNERLAAVLESPVSVRWWPMLSVLQYRHHVLFQFMVSRKSAGLIRRFNSRNTAYSKNRATERHTSNRCLLLHESRRRYDE